MPFGDTCPELNLWVPPPPRPADTDSPAATPSDSISSDEPSSIDLWERPPGREMMTVNEKKTLVAEFLSRCNRYADDKLAEYRAALDGASGSRALELQDKIGHWTAYRAFNEHTIAELRSAKLDEWFAESGPPNR